MAFDDPTCREDRSIKNLDGRAIEESAPSGDARLPSRNWIDSKPVPMLNAALSWCKAGAGKR